MLATAAAHAAPTAFSTFSASGSDVATGSVATSDGVAGTARASDVLGWTLRYRNLAGARAGVEISDVIAGNQEYVLGSLRTPPGIAAQTSTDGGLTFEPSEPAAGVNTVGGRGTSIAGSTGDQVPTQPTALGFDGGTVGGDGWEPLFVDANVYTIHHHRDRNRGHTLLDCHIKATGASCPGSPAIGTYVSETAGDPLGTGADTLTSASQNNAVVDQEHGRIYFPAGRDHTPNVGIGCIDVRLLESCGYETLGDPGSLNNAGTAEISGGGAIGSRYYLLDSTGRIYCFDYATRMPCAGLAAPTPHPTGDYVAYSQLAVFDDRYVFASLKELDNTRGILCLDTVTGSACPGFPIRGYGGMLRNDVFSFDAVLAPVIDTDGALSGISDPSSEATYACWDFALEATCAGFVQTSTRQVVRAYSLRQDPYAPDCIWAIGDAGRFEVFSATFGGTDCARSVSSLRVGPARYYESGGESARVASVSRRTPSLPTRWLFRCDVRFGGPGRRRRCAPPAIQSWTTAWDAGGEQREADCRQEASRGRHRERAQHSGSRTTSSRQICSGACPQHEWSDAHTP